MSYYERFRGLYDVEMRKLEERRQIVIDKARELSPADLDERLAASEDGEFDYDLNWVDVPNPWQPERGGTITVRPILSCAVGYPDADREKDRSDKGVRGLGIEARLPSGDHLYMGDILFTYVDGRPKHEEPMLSVNIESSPDGFGSYTHWESADAELFLTLAESALAVQPESNQ